MALPLLLAQAPGGSPSSMLILFGLLFAVMYFVMIRPQQKQMREHKALIAALKKGDDVITQGGLIGKIHAVTDKVVTLEVAPSVRIRVLKTSIQGKAQVSEEATLVRAEEKKEEK